MSSTPSLKYSKRIAALGAASAAVLSLGTASAAVSTVEVGVNVTSSSASFNFVPTGTSYVSGDSGYPALIRNCGLHLFNNPSSNFQWASELIPAGGEVDDSLSYEPSIYFQYPAEGETVYAGYRTHEDIGDGRFEDRYGYVSITGGATPVGMFYPAFTINSYTYESTINTGISIAAVPEPSAALLAFAGAGLFFRRRRG